MSEEQANAHGDIAIHLGLSRRSRHEVTAAQALVQRHPSDMNLLSFQRASEQNRIGGDPSHQTGSSTLLANNPLAGLVLPGMRTPSGLCRQSRGAGSRRCLAVVPRHPLLRILLQVRGVPLQLGQIIERLVPHNSAVWMRLIKRSPTRAPCRVL